MAILKKLNWKNRPWLKIAGLAVLGLAVIYIAFSLLGSFFMGLPHFQQLSLGGGVSNYAPSYPAPAGTAELQSLSFGKSASLSQRNAATLADSNYYNNGSPAGANAEQYESTEYGVSYENRKLKNTCAAIAGLKTRPDVVFESASESDNNCNYYFKVERAKANEILDILKGLKPKELSTTTYTIQQQVQDFTSEISILQDRLAAIDDTLSKATAAYDDVTALATKEKDVDSLAKVIDDKINTIQQLTQARIDINSQLDQIQRSKTDQLDKLNYTYFNVNAADNNFFNWKDIKDSWNSAIRISIANVDELVQNISVNLAVFLLTILQYAIYALILLIVAKFGWKLAKRVWQN